MALDYLQFNVDLYPCPLASPCLQTNACLKLPVPVPKQAQAHISTSWGHYPAAVSPSLICSPAEHALNPGLPAAAAAV